MTSLLSALCGCSGNAPQYLSAEDFPPAYEKPVPELPGKLAGVTHESSAGSMSFGSEFAIELTPEKILHCEYWDPESPIREMVHKDDIPVTQQQWADVEKGVLDLWGVWEEVPKSRETVPKDPDMHVLDGGDYQRWWLTWETPQGTERIQYYNPGDRRILTLDALLRELADPAGREIVWYEAPVLSGATYINEKTDMSFQCNWWDLPAGAEEGYRLIVRFEEDGREVSVYDRTDDAMWTAARPAFAWLDPEAFGGRSSRAPVTLSLYYSDGSQKSLTLDNKTARMIEPYLRRITLQYLEDQ